MAEPKMKIKRDYSDKSDAALRKMMEKDSGASVADVKAAYNELAKRKGGLDFTVTMVLGGRELGKDDIIMPTPKPKKKMAYGGMSRKKYNKGGYANCGASVPATQKSSQKMAKGGMLKKPDNPGLAKLPTPVRNKMGYMMKGGYAKKK